MNGHEDKGRIQRWLSSQVLNFIFDCLATSHFCSLYEHFGLMSQKTQCRSQKTFYEFVILIDRNFRLVRMMEMP